MSLFRDVLHRRYLFSPGPWRALVYVLTTLPVAAPVGAAMTVLAVPWIAGLSRLTDHAAPTHDALLFMFVSLVLFAGFGPVAAVPLGVVERSRLALLDPRPVSLPHGPAGAGPAGWVRARYAETATWRELLYVAFLGLVVPTVYFGYALLVLLDIALLVSPLFASTGTAAWTFGVFTVDSAGAAVPLAIVGAVLSPVLVYLLGLIAAGQAAATRALLSGRVPTAPGSGRVPTRPGTRSGRPDRRYAAG